MEEDLRLVCFDVGGVLVRICRSWAEAGARAGLKPRAGAEAPEVAAAVAACSRRYHAGELDLAAFARLLSAATGGLFVPGEIESIYDAWLLGEYDGVAGVVDDLHAAGLATAVLSNTTREHWGHIVQLGSIARVQHRFASHLTGLLKPEAAAYEYVTAALGLQPWQILFFDDTRENIEAAAACGWRAQAIDPLQATAPQIRRALARHGL